MVSDGHRALLDDALRELGGARAGAPSGPAMLKLVALLTPVVQARVTRVLFAHGRGRAMTNLRSEVEETTQMVFGRLFEREGHVLRLWDVEGGLSLKNWVGRIASLRTRDMLRSAQRDPWRQQASPPDFFERMTSAVHAEHSVQTQQMWDTVRTRVLERQTDLGKSLFRLLFEEDCTTAEIRAETKMADGAIFKWRSRLRKELSQEWQSLVSEGGA